MSAEPMTEEALTAIVERAFCLHPEALRCGYEGKRALPIVTEEITLLL